MNQKILSEIKSIAAEIGNSSNLDTAVLKEKISKLYEKLVVLEFLENSISDIENITPDNSIEIEEEEDENDFDAEENVTTSDSLDFLKVEEVSEDEVTIPTLEKEVEEEVPTDKTIDENNLSKSINNSIDATKSSLHEELKKSTIQIGLNDRIAFVKRLFDGNQQDFHRVLSQVNTFSNIEEVREFIDTMVKPEHNWDNHEEYAHRFMEIIENKFQ
ncbi:MAG: hypothetical protein KAG37_11230 [Flavobacteriales bacterium]|nr:hypothetical protein [Flavobacteriales bacterium]